MKAAVGRRWLLLQRVSLIKDEVPRVQAAGASDKWMGSQSLVVAGLRALPGSGLLRPVPVLGRGRAPLQGRAGTGQKAFAREALPPLDPNTLKCYPRGKAENTHYGTARFP